MVSQKQENNTKQNSTKVRCFCTRHNAKNKNTAEVERVEKLKQTSWEEIGVKTPHKNKQYYGLLIFLI